MTARKTTPAAAEALGALVPFTFGDVDYLIPPTSEWTYDALEAFEDGKITAFLRAILGDAQHVKFKATKPRIADVTEFVDAMQKALGISGN